MISGGSGRDPAALAADGEGVDPGQLREDRVALGGAVGRVAGRQHQLRRSRPGLMISTSLGSTISCLCDRVGEGRVGHLDPDLVARSRSRRCGGTGPGRWCGGRRSRPSRAGPGSGVFLVVAGALLQGGGVGALHDHDVEADPVDLDAPDRVPLLRCRSRSGRRGSAPSPRCRGRRRSPPGRRRSDTASRAR